MLPPISFFQVRPLNQKTQTESKNCSIHNSFFELLLRSCHRIYFFLSAYCYSYNNSFLHGWFVFWIGDDALCSCASFPPHHFEKYECCSVLLLLIWVMQKSVSIITLFCSAFTWKCLQDFWDQKWCRYKLHLLGAVGYDKLCSDFCLQVLLLFNNYCLLALFINKHFRGF